MLPDNVAFAPWALALAGRWERHTASLGAAFFAPRMNGFGPGFFPAAISLIVRRDATE